MILVQIAPDHLARAAIQAVKERCNERWDVDYVVDRINAGHAGLFVLRDDGKRLAHIVVERHEGYEVVINLWIVGGSRGVRSVAEVVRLFDDLARSAGATYWKWESPRPGWERLFRKFLESGEIEMRKVYERKVP